MFIYMPYFYNNYIGEFAKPGDRKFQDSKEYLPDKYASLYYRQDSAYIEHLNHKILLLHAMGLVKLEETWFN